MESVAFAAIVLLAAAVAAGAICMRYGGTFGWLLRSAALRYGTGLIAVPAIAVGLLAHGVAGGWGAGALGSALAALPVVIWLARARKGVTRLIAGGSEVVAEAVAELKRRKQAEGSRSIGFQVAVAATARRLMVKGRLDAAAEVLWLLDWDELEPPILASAATSLASCLLASGLMTDARAALERAREHVDEYPEKGLYHVLDARLLVHEGKAKEALARMAQLERLVKAHPELGVEKQVTHIHAVAATGDDATALALLGALHKELGAAGLDALKQPSGPATQMAVEFGMRSAYR